MAGLEGKFNGESRIDVIDNSRDRIRNPELDELYRNLFNEDYDGKVVLKPQEPNIRKFNPKEEMARLFSDDYSKINNLTEKSVNNMEGRAGSKNEVSNDGHKPDAKLETNGVIYKTDDNGTVYKINGELKPNTEYTIDGMIYKTDARGRIILCDGNAKQTPDGERDSDAQKQVGGEDRRKGDQGGHILSRILGGAKGIENLLAIRDKINNGPYKAMENEINDALGKGKDVHIHVEVKYDGDSKRPARIIVTYTIDGRETVTEYDNDEGSLGLLDTLEDKVDKEQYDDLKQEIADANADGGNISVIAVKTEYDGDGDVTKVTVTMRDENSGRPNEKRVLLPKEDKE